MLNNSGRLLLTSIICKDLQISANNFVFNLNRNFLTPRIFQSQCAPDSRVDTSFNNDSTEDKSPDLEKLKEAKLNHLKNK